jgi:hypothetical protein
MNQTLLTPCKQTSCAAHSACLFLSSLGTFLSWCQATPCQLWPQGDSSSGRAHAPSLWAETKLGVYSGMPHATLGESYLIMASDDCFSFPPCLMPLLPETVTREWRFHVAESIPVPVNGSDLEAQMMANHLGVCYASRLCLLLPHLRCQDNFYASSMVSPHVFCLCLPSPPWVYWDPASHEKLVAWYLMS